MRYEELSFEDPGADPYFHGVTFLTAMIASWIEQSEITQVQSQKDISEVQQPLCVWKRRELGQQVCTASEC